MTPESPETFYLAFLESIYQLRMVLEDVSVNPMHQFVSDVTGCGARMWFSLRQQMREEEEEILIHSPQNNSSHAMKSTFSCMTSSGFFSI